MKFVIAITSLLGAALIGQAQDGGETVNVPLDNSARPVQLRAHLISGSISVRGGDVKDVVVEARSRDGHDRHEEHRPAPPGMKRLNIGGNGLDITEEDNTVEVRVSPPRPCDLVITVPRNASLQLKSINDGEISVENVAGEIDADDLNGGIALRNVSGSVVAHSLNGPVTVSFDRVDATKPMSFSTMNGNIDVTLPGDTRANVRLKTDNGEIYTDFEVKLDGASHMSTGSGDSRNGRYHIRFDRGLHGAINGGGPEYQFTSFNGQIYLRKKK